MIRLDTKSGRAALEPRPAPYFVKLSKGRFLGLRKLAVGPATWTARYRAEDGAQLHHVLGEDSPTFAYDEAARAAAEWFKLRDQGVTGRTDDGRAVTVGAVCKLYVTDRRKQKGAGTGKDYQRAFERSVYGGGGKKGDKHEANAIASIPLAKFRSRHLTAWRDGLIEAGATRSTANRMRTRLVAALNYAVRERYVGADVAIEWKSVQPFAGASKRRDLYLDLDQRRALLKASTGAARDLIEAAAVTGARPGELVAARRSAFDARTNSLTLSGKTGSRTIPLSPAGVALFTRFAEGKLPGAFLLTRDDGKQWAHSDWDELVRDAAKAAELPRGTCLYTLRHSWITTAITDGISPLEVARLVGTSLAMIDRNYGHLALSTTRERLAEVGMV
jgi:integrase